jgi:AraC-like DNA-binding protein
MEPAKDPVHDVLDDVFRLIHLKGCVYFQRDFHAPWAMRMEKGLHAQFHVVAEGTAVVETEEGCHVLQAGDLLLFPGGEAHTLADRTGRTPVPGKAVVASFDTAEPLFSDGGTATRLICGHYEYRRGASHPLFDGLPEMMLIRASQGRQPTAFDRMLLELLVSESAKSGPGVVSVVERLAEVLLVHIVRQHFADHPESIGFLSGVMDKRLSRAISRIHRDCSASLTLADLAGNAGMSRSGFAEHFRQKTGLAPIEYVTKWRMLSAGELLRDVNLSVPDVASRIGYNSDAAFARAFKREFGITPARYRRDSVQA